MTHDGQIVSDPNDMLILVDEEDLEQGTLSKHDCHTGEGVLHRAFSIFIFNDAGQLLLQQRGADNPLWPLFWSNSCCSHPRAGEESETAARRRLLEELGIDAELRFLYKFAYHARYLDRGSERELCWVWVGRSGDPVRANPTEIEATRYVTPAELDEELRHAPELFTPWMKMEWEEMRRTGADLAFT